MAKRHRQQAIKDLISREHIYKQDALAYELKRLGFKVTQSTLSRDISDLRLVKSKDGYVNPEDAKSSGKATVPDLAGTLKRLVIKMEQCENLLTVRTVPGSSSLVVSSIDGESFDGIIGTLGGDDTALLITKSHKDASALKRQLLDMIG